MRDCYQNCDTYMKRGVKSLANDISECVWHVNHSTPRFSIPVLVSTGNILHARHMRGEPVSSLTCLGTHRQHKPNKALHCVWKQNLM